MGDFLQTRIDVRERNGASFSPKEVVMGDLATASFLAKGYGQQWFLLSFIRFLCFGLVLLLGSISFYSFELRLGFKVVRVMLMTFLQWTNCFNIFMLLLSIC